jgi:hypothetical protein
MDPNDIGLCCNNFDACSADFLEIWTKVKGEEPIRKERLVTKRWWIQKQSQILFGREEGMLGKSKDREINTKSTIIFWTSLSESSNRP